jgi:hypothetical protein
LLAVVADSIPVPNALTLAPDDEDQDTDGIEPESDDEVLDEGDLAERLDTVTERLKSYLSVKQVVERLNGAISVKLVYKLIEQGKLRANRATGKVLVEEDSLVELMEGPRKPVVEEEPPPPKRPRGRPRKQEMPLW